jgi:hypothetical protein
MNDLKQLIKDYVKIEELLNGFFGIEPARPLLHPPAPAKELDDLEQYLRHRKLSFPPSYRAFLATCNGITGFNADLNLLSAKEVFNPVDMALESDFPNLAAFVIAQGNTSAFISFDSETTDEAGEMEVVWVTEDGVEFRYPNFGVFLQMVHDQSLETLKQEQADRENLTDN